MLFPMSHFNVNVNRWQNMLTFSDSSEAAQARLKGLDSPGPVVAPKPAVKDVNTYKNNQVKFSAGGGTIPSDQLKCNILKAKHDEEMKKVRAGMGMCKQCSS